MPSTVYRGDLSEITFGHESGVVLEHGFGGTDFKFTAKNGGQNLTADTSVIALSSATNAAGNPSTSPMKDGLLLYPKGMLVGSRVIFSGLAGSTDKFLTDDNYNVKGRSYTIVKHDVTNSNITELTLTPALKTVHNSSTAKDSETGGKMHILPFGTPAYDKTMDVDGDNAIGSTEAVLTDQFVGLVSTVALPETKVDLKRYHVVGLGRDVAVQVPGRYTNAGGSFECNIHNGRWFYYCLGQKVSKAGAKGNGGATYTLSSGADAGSTYVHITGAVAIPSVDVDGSSTNITDNNSYLVLTDSGNATVDIQTYRETNVGDAKDHTDAWPNVGAANVFDRAVKQEIRRIIGHAVSGSGSTAIHSLWLDEPLQYDYTNPTVEFAKYEAGNAATSPGRASTGVLTNPVEHLYFSREKVPSFSMEVSLRRLDQGHNVGTTDGGTTDSKQLTRVFRGCKVKDFSMTADTDAALRMTVNFDSAFCYTDTGRLESDTAATATLTALSKSAGDANTRVLTLSDGTNSVSFAIDNSTSTSTATVIGYSNANSNANQFATNIAAAVNAAKTAGTLNMSASASDATVTLTQDNTGAAGNTTPSGTAISDSVITLTSAFIGGGSKGDRYNAHRLFEDTAANLLDRKASGIEKGTQKPFMFYNGIITVLGQTVGQVVSFTLNGSTGVEQFYTISAANIVDNETDQVPHAGTRNPALAVEGKTEYDMDMEIIVDDPVFYHRMRRAVRNFDKSTSDSVADDLIRLSFTKNTTAAGDAESIDILIDDFFITEASLPIPEDKGPIRSTMKILPKTIKVIAKDTVLAP